MKTFLFLLGILFLFNACCVPEPEIPPAYEDCHVIAESEVIYYENNPLSRSRTNARVLIKAGAIGSQYPIYGGEILFFEDTMSYSSLEQLYTYTGTPPPYTGGAATWKFLGAPQMPSYEQGMYASKIEHVYKPTVIKKNRPFEVRCEQFDNTDSITYSVWLDSIPLSTVTKAPTELTHEFPKTVFDSVRVGSEIELRVSTSDTYYYLLPREEDIWAVYKHSTVYSEFVVVDF